MSWEGRNWFLELFFWFIELSDKVYRGFFSYKNK